MKTSLYDLFWPTSLRRKLFTAADCIIVSQHHNWQLLKWNRCWSQDILREKRNLFVTPNIVLLRNFGIMSSSAFMVTIFIIAISLPHTLSFHSSRSILGSRTSSSSKRFLSPVVSELSQIVSTTITSATIEIASNEIVAKQIFEPQISTETGIGITSPPLILFILFYIRMFCTGV